MEGRAGSPLSKWKMVLFLGGKVIAETFWVMVISQVIASGWWAKTASLKRCWPLEKGGPQGFYISIWEETWAHSTRSSVCAWLWPCYGLSPHAEAGQVPRAGCPRQSQSVGAGLLGSPPGSLCATAGAGATVGSASVTWRSQECTLGLCVNATSGCARPTTVGPVQVREDAIPSLTHQLLRERGNTFFWGFRHFPQGEKGRHRPLLTGPSRKLEVIAICEGILLLVNSGIVL